MRTCPSYIFCVGPDDDQGPISGYRQVSNISRTLVGNKIVDHSDVAGASPVAQFIFE